MWVIYKPQNSYMTETSPLKWNTILTFINAIINWTTHRLWRETEYNTIDQKVEWPFVTCQATAMSGNAYYSTTSFYVYMRKKQGYLINFSLLQSIFSEYSRPSSYCRCLQTVSTPALYVKTTLVLVTSTGPSSHLCYMSFHSIRIAYCSSSHVLLSCAGRGLMMADCWYNESH